MKRLSKEQKESLHRRLCIRALAKKRSKARVKKKKIQVQRSIRSYRGTERRRLNAPIIFDIETPQNRPLLAQFLEDLREHFKNKPDQALLIDFKGTQRFVASGTLLFYAELCRLVEYRPNLQIRCTRPNNERASQVLQQIGVYKICHHPYRGQPNRHDVVHWRVARGHIVDASQYASAIEEHEGKLAPPLVDGIYRGLAEAMTNVCHHAYIEQREDGLKHEGSHDWWVFSQARDGYLYVALCDLGVGIPRTLPSTNQNLYMALKSKLGVKPADSECITAAIEESRSRTGRRERGKGLGDIFLRFLTPLEDEPQFSAIMAGSP